MCKELQKVIMASNMIFSSGSTLTHEDAEDSISIMPPRSVPPPPAGAAASPALNCLICAQEAACPPTPMNHNAAKALTANSCTRRAAAVTTENLSPNTSSTGASVDEIPCPLQLSKHPHVQLMTGPHHQISISDGNSSVIATYDALDQRNPPNLHEVIPHGSLKLQVLSGDHDRASIEVLQQNDHAEQISFFNRADRQSSSNKLHARTWSPENSMEDDPLEEAENDQEAEEELQGAEAEEEEEGCRTPTASDQRIPQFDTASCAGGLVCPPAPKKKQCASKRRRLWCSANDRRFQIVAERRPFLVDPPDLHNFPDCIRALFK